MIRCFYHKAETVIFSVQILFGTFLVLSRIQRDVITCDFWSACKVPVKLFLSHLNETWFFSTEFARILKYQIFGAELFRALMLHGRTDTAKLIANFRSFVNGKR
jgi:hypothetical protein